MIKQYSLVALLGLSVAGQALAQLNKDEECISGQVDSSPSSNGRILYDQSNNSKVENYTFLGLANYDLRTNPISTGLPEKSFLESMLKQGTVSNRSEGEQLIRKTGLRYSVNIPANQSVGFTFYFYDKEDEESNVIGRVHAKSLVDLGTPENPRALFYFPKIPIEDMTYADAVHIAENQKGLRIIPMDSRIPEIDYKTVITAEEYNDLWQKGDPDNAPLKDKQALRNARNGSKPINFAPSGTTILIKNMNPQGTEEYMAWKIGKESDWGAFNEDRPFSRRYDRNWFTDVKVKRLIKP